MIPFVTKNLFCKIAIVLYTIVFLVTTFVLQKQFMHHILGGRKMLMVYAMIFDAHLLAYGWLYLMPRNNMEEWLNKKFVYIAAAKNSFLKELNIESAYLIK